MCHFSLSLCTASEPKLPSTYPIERSTLLQLFVSAASILVSSTEAVQVTLADAIVLRHRILLHKACPLRDILGRGGQEGGGERKRGGAFYQRGEKQLSEIQNK